MKVIDLIHTLMQVPPTAEVIAVEFDTAFENEPTIVGPSVFVFTDQMDDPDYLKADPVVFVGSQSLFDLVMHLKKEH